MSFHIHILTLVFIYDLQIWGPIQLLWPCLLGLESKLHTNLKTRSAHRTHLRTYLSFVVFMDLPLQFTIHSVLGFLEYLYVNNISYRVILNYLASLRSMAKHYDWHPAVLSHQLVLSYLKSISRNTCFNPPY